MLFSNRQIHIRKKPSGWKYSNIKIGKTGCSSIEQPGSDCEGTHKACVHLLPWDLRSSQMQKRAGHGVPGAMVSVVCSNALNRVVKEPGITQPGKILDKVRDLVVETFAKSESEVKDGMDISLCALNVKTKQLQWAGANNPLWLIRPSTGSEAYELTEYKSDKQPIGKHTDARPFTTHTIELKDGDTLYVFTDGYSDQFGGEKGKKFKTSNLKKLLLSIQDKNMEEQHLFIDQHFEEWRAQLEQVDDVCIIGVRI